MAYNWAGDVVVGLWLQRSSGSSSLQVYQLNGSQLRQLGPTLPPQPQLQGFAVAIDARGPVVAWLAGGFVVVRRWDGANWTQLGPNVNQSPNIFVKRSNRPRSR